MLNMQTVSFNLVFQIIFKGFLKIFASSRRSLMSSHPVSLASIHTHTHTHSATAVSPCAKPTITGKIKPRGSFPNSQK